MKALIYTRVSKRDQNFDRQVNDLGDVARKEKYDVVKVISEKISGNAKNDKRKGVGELLEYINNSKVDIVLCTEVSRLGRRPSEVDKIVNELCERDIPVYVHNYKLTTLIKGDNGEYKRNPFAMIMFSLLKEFAYMERETMIERIHSGLNEARRKGKTLGRKKGTTMSDEDILQRYPKLAAELRNGQSIRRCMKLFDVSKGTVIRVKRLV